MQNYKELINWRLGWHKVPVDFTQQQHLYFIAVNTVLAVLVMRNKHLFIHFLWGCLVLLYIYFFLKYTFHLPFRRFSVAFLASSSSSSEGKTLTTSSSVPAVPVTLESTSSPTATTNTLTFLSRRAFPTFINCVRLDEARPLVNKTIFCCASGLPAFSNKLPASCSPLLTLDPLIYFTLPRILSSTVGLLSDWINSDKTFPNCEYWTIANLVSFVGVISTIFMARFLVVSNFSGSDAPRTRTISALRAVTPKEEEEE